MRDSEGRFIKGSKPYNKKNGRYIKCSRCSNKFYVIPSAEKLGFNQFCSRKCKNPPLFKVCRICRKEFRIKPSYYYKRFTCSRNCFQIDCKTRNKYWLNKKRPEMIGKNNWKWKGDKVGYGGLHMWIKGQKGKPLFCKMKDITCQGKFEWANISHTYKRDIEDFMSLCKSHHARYDSK
jgi:hypothetical protein